MALLHSSATQMRPLSQCGHLALMIKCLQHIARTQVVVCCVSSAYQRYRKPVPADSYTYLWSIIQYTNIHTLIWQPTNSLTTQSGNEIHPESIFSGRSNGPDFVDLETELTANFKSSRIDCMCFWSTKSLRISLDYQTLYYILWSDEVQFRRISYQPTSQTSQQICLEQAGRATTDYQHRNSNVLEVFICRRFSHYDEHCLGLGVGLLMQSQSRFFVARTYHYDPSTSLSCAKVTSDNGWFTEHLGDQAES